MKISFDFDGCLGEKHIQMLAKLLIAAGADVWCITSRFDDNIYDENGAFQGYRGGQNQVVRDVCSNVGIPHHKIIYTNGAFKVNEYAKGSFDLHFDDMFDEVEAIQRNGGKALLVDFSVYDLKQALDSVDDVEVYFEKMWKD
jgi:hypothetical protein